ncbi:hypothetical protein Moror_12620 [Moniliophthora roreri MCA 2997]|uniref:Uncharacterized protein n=2 Tax=Moniliophthora roreri TaxID=221103 RepID=V2X8V9_MONRO|nr:hypothetical protein Moror_12620 [Moniliophthora roreri MCA 2997]
MAQLPHIANGVESTDKIVMLQPPSLSLHSSIGVQYDGLAELFNLCDTTKEVIKPIYLFIYLVHVTTISELMAWETGCTHFWSFDKTGQSEILDDKQKEIGLELTASLILP